MMEPTFGKVVRYVDPKTRETHEGMVIGTEPKGHPDGLVISPDHDQGNHAIITKDDVQEIIG